MSDMQRSSARDTALEVLMQVSRANAWSDGSLKRTIAKNKLDSREAALCTRLAYGVIQNRGLLDYYIGLLVQPEASPAGAGDFEYPAHRRVSDPVHG